MWVKVPGVANEVRRRLVLVVDDDASYRDALSSGLTAEGFTVYLASDGRTALEQFVARRPDVVLLDLRLPDIPGTDVCKEIRSISDVPVLMLSAVAEEVDVVLSLTLGADDYLTKPFRLRELVARIDKAIRNRERYRKAMGLPREPIGVRQIGPFEIDFEGRIVTLDKKRVILSRLEFDLFAHLARDPGRVCSRKELMDEVWGTESAHDHTLNTHVYRLRAKLEKDPAHPNWIVTVRGVGFLLNDGLRGVGRSVEADGDTVA